MNMKKKVLATLLTAAMVVSSVTPVLAAPTPVTADGTVYNPTDVVDVIVPTAYEFAINPLGVAIDNGTLKGNGQIISGTYAIQNRSTVPVEIGAKFVLTPGEVTRPTNSDDVKIKLGTDADVAKNDAGELVNGDTDFETPVISMGLQTAAKGSAVTLVDSSYAAGAIAGVSNTEAQESALASTTTNSALKVAKLSTDLIALTTGSANASTGAITTDVKFTLAAGPWDPVYVKDTMATIPTQTTSQTQTDTDNGSGGTTQTQTDITVNTTTQESQHIDNIVYKLKNNTGFDTVGFTFTGKVSKNTAEWSTLKAGSKTSIAVTYTVTPKTAAEYAKVDFSATNKGVVYDATKSDVTVSSSADGSAYTFGTAPTYTVTAKDDPTPDPDRNKVTVLSLKAGAKATQVALKEFGTFTPAVAATDSTSASPAKMVVKKEVTDILEAGSYQITFGKQVFYLTVQ